MEEKRPMKLQERVLSLPRWQKQITAPLVDIGLCVLAFWLALCSRLESFVTLQSVHWAMSLTTGLVLVVCFFARGQYNAIFRYTGLDVVAELVKPILLISIAIFAVFTLYVVPGIPRSLGTLFPLYLLVLLVSVRIFVRGLFIWLTRLQSSEVRNVVIYGAGWYGDQLLRKLIFLNNIKVVGFLDDDEKKVGNVNNGVPVFRPVELDNLIALRGAKEIYLALPNISKARRREIFENLRVHDISVKMLKPTAYNLENGDVFDNLKDISVEDITGRNILSPDRYVISQTIKGKTILVTGAGGSIGSVLSKQIIAHKPKRLILLDNSEHGLFKVREDLSGDSNTPDTLNIDYCLVDIRDKKRLEHVFASANIDVVFHAAAYKHVNLVENNLFSGLKNNIFGTLNVAKAADNAGAKSFVLISTDKAVRPSTVMGASKRIAELIVTSFAHRSVGGATNGACRFITVRFGNVFNSSGSVVPIFKKQIENGGPLTVSHPNVKRYFMSIEEATQLVIQACAIGQGGEILVLDMGDPVKIMDLAKQMIWLSGLSLKDEDHPDGDIEIVITKLNRGDKLEEELLYSRTPVGTDHAKIWRDRDERFDWPQLAKQLAGLRLAIDESDTEACLEILNHLVPSYSEKSRKQQLRLAHNAESPNIIQLPKS